jgi:hypothetical protein
MKRFKKGGYPVGALVAVELIGTVLLGTVCEFSGYDYRYPNGMYRIKPLREESRNTHWVDADAVWSLEEIERRRAYLEELDRLIAEAEHGQVIWELLAKERRDVGRIAPALHMKEELEAIKKTRAADARPLV